MTRMPRIECTVVSNPVIENESPFYLSFHINVKGDVMPATFVGDLARALKNNIRIGDNLIINDGLVDDGKVVFGHLYMETKAAFGRNVNCYA